MNGWIEICMLDDIPRLGARVVQRGTAVPIALFRTGADKVFALIDRCPHRGGPLSQGLVAGDRVVCPLHGWTIELSGGQAVAPDEGCAHSYAVEVRDGHVHLREADLVVADFVVPAKAGTQPLLETSQKTLGPRLRGDDADASPARERQSL
jgi:nitrite reductase [NAD(P)H] small subunit